MAHLFQINVSGGGIPKLPLRQALVSASGVAGDRQNNLEFHGGPDRAVCLYSLELIMALQAEGHPAHPGSTGENLTITGLDWERVVPGARLQVGGMVQLEITSYTKPCRTIAPSFADGDPSRIAHETHPGWSRLYARVLAPGRVTIGDPVELLAPA